MLGARLGAVRVRVSCASSHTPPSLLRHCGSVRLRACGIVRVCRQGCKPQQVYRCVYRSPTINISFARCPIPLACSPCISRLPSLPHLLPLSPLLPPTPTATTGTSSVPAVLIVLGTSMCHIKTVYCTACLLTLAVALY
jgi:hypothetical protein